MKVATYSRISTDEDRQPFSLGAQKDRLEAYISSQDGWTLTRSYTDQVSGKTLDRPGLGQALTDARNKRFELLLVFKVDRLARSTSGLVQVLEGLDAAGVAFRSVSEPFDTSTAAGRMMIQMLGVFAEFEREMIVERTKMGLAKKASKGEWTGGKPPYGYSYDIDQKLLVPIDKEAALIRQIFDRYAARKWGSARISKWLNERARTTRSGYAWTPKTILDVLRNPTYTGKLPFNGDVFDAAHEPIIDVDLFGQTQDLLKVRREDMPLRAANATPYLLTGLLTCSRCGHGFIGTRASGKNAVYRYYTCYCRQRNGSVKCDQERIPADRLEGNPQGDHRSPARSQDIRGSCSQSARIMDRSSSEQGVGTASTQLGHRRKTHDDSPLPTSLREGPDARLRCRCAGQRTRTGHRHP